MIQKSIQWLKDKIAGKPTKTADKKGRSSQWAKIRKEHLLKNPKCEWCEGTKKLEVHHIKPFHLHPELELDPNNLITLCETKTECHLLHGHLGSWQKENPAILQECQERKLKKSNN